MLSEIVASVASASGQGGCRTTTISRVQARSRSSVRLRKITAGTIADR